MSFRSSHTSKLCSWNHF